MNSWLSYWDAPNKSYVSERHKRAHYDVLFSGIRSYLPGPDSLVLDWGCGDALAAERIAELSGTILLYDAADSARDRLRGRFGSHPRIRILDQSGLDELAGDTINLVMVNSVIQYLSSEEFDDALALFHRLIKPGGAFLLGDVISPGTGNSRHVTTFLRFARSHGFLLSAVGGLARTFISPYRRLQREVGLAAHAPAHMLETLEQHGFIAEKLPRNVAVSDHRSSYLARKPDHPSQSAAARLASEHERGAA
jgi:SAM-dependent methyltransferase